MRDVSTQGRSKRILEAKQTKQTAAFFLQYTLRPQDDDLPRVSTALHIVLQGIPNHAMTSGI